MILLFLFTGVLCTERWIQRFDSDVQPLIYHQNRSFRQSWWDLIIYDEEPPEEYEDLEDLDEMWNVKRWFTYHLKALKTQSLTRDDLANILLWFDRLEDEAIQLFVFDVTECDWNGDGKLGLDESHQLNYLMMNEYSHIEGDSRGTFQLWNIRFLRAMYGQKETILNDRQLLKYFKPYQYKSMAYALAEEWHLTFDRDIDDLVSKKDYETILNETAYYVADRDLMLKQFDKFDINHDGIVGWKETYTYYELNASLEFKINKIVDETIDACDLDYNGKIDRFEIKNSDCWEELDQSRLTFYGRFVDFGHHMRTNSKPGKQLTIEDLQLFNYPLYLRPQQVKSTIKQMQDKAKEEKVKEKNENELFLEE